MNLPIVAEAVPIGSEPMPVVPGCYILFFRSHATPDLSMDISFRNDVVYVGKSESSIEKRVHNSHLLSGKSGSSTLRRSLGALLRDKLHLEPRPRSANPVDTKRFRNYKFDDASEQRLSEWISRNILGAAVPSATPLATENALIAALAPPLCLSKWRNPWKRQLSDLRKQCRLLAEEWERTQ
jgi:hypothetical protein